MPLPKAPTQPAALLGEQGIIPARETPRLTPERIGRNNAKTAPPSEGSLNVQRAIAAKSAQERPTTSGNSLNTVVQRAIAPLPKPRRSTTVSDEAKKLFVLDTNVLMHDPSSLFRFQEHDILLPMVTLEELDNNKKGMSEVARNARHVSRSLDALASQGKSEIEQGLPLNTMGHKDATGKLFFQTAPIDPDISIDLPMGKADNQILAVVIAQQRLRPTHAVVLVTKDINMRIKARALGLPAEDYFNDQVIEDGDVLYSGIQALPENFWDKHGKNIESWAQGGSTFYRLTGPLVGHLIVNQFVYLENAIPLAAQVREVTDKVAVLQTLRDFTHTKNAVWGITARNREQNFALNVLMNPEIDFVTLLGQAGTGKTLLALAAALVQTIDTRRYSEIIVTRATVPVGEDIGYLPGTEEEKMQPWMGALEDNLEVLMNGQDGNGGVAGAVAGGEWGRAAAQDMIKSRIKVKAMSFMRGRTFISKFLIIDEAQNLTPKQMKTLITRAGPGSKVVCLGNVAQIDTPYLTESSSGLTFVVDRFKGWAHSGHIVLQRGERSRLADFASEAL
jgi:PhoH-like ATPase